MKGMVTNTAERAVSTDLNRMQALASGGLMELMRFLLHVDEGTDDVLAGGYATENVATGTPLSGEVLGGLMVVPVNNTLQLGVTDGVLMCINPDISPSPDDSPYKYVQDVGIVGTSGSLLLTANSSGSIRIDVIECQRVDDPSPEEDSRDIFNPTTGLFTAGTVQKTIDSTLAYRVRAGTAGSGFPGLAAGWMPLCIASVPDGTTACDTVTFWDVRPLLHDRIFGTSPVEQDLPRRTKLLYSSSLGAGAHHIANGVVEVSYGQRRLGGQLRRGSPGSDVNQGYVDFSLAANQEDSYVYATSPQALTFYYLLTPFGLPRWARYTDYVSAPTSRTPRSPRGIPLLSNVPPVHVYGTPTTAIVFPAVFGFNGASTSSGVCYGAAAGAAGALQPQCTTDGWSSGFEPMPAVAGSAPATGLFTLLENTSFPAGATRLRIAITFQLTQNAGGGALPSETFLVEMTDLWMSITGEDTTQWDTAFVDTKECNIGTPDTVVTDVGVTWVFEIGVVNDYPVKTTPQSYDLNYEIAALPTHVSINGNPSAQVVGWKME